MLNKVAPRGRRVRFPPQELLLLWQAHQVCADKAYEVAQLLEERPYVSFSQREAMDEDDGTSHCSTPDHNPSATPHQSSKNDAAFGLGEELHAQGKHCEHLSLCVFPSIS